MRKHFFKFWKIPKCYLFLDHEILTFYLKLILCFEFELTSYTKGYKQKWKYFQMYQVLKFVFVDPFLQPAGKKFRGTFSCLRTENKFWRQKTNYQIITNAEPLRLTFSDLKKHTWYCVKKRRALQISSDVWPRCKPQSLRSAMLLLEIIILTVVFNRSFTHICRPFLEYRGGKVPYDFVSSKSSVWSRMQEQDMGVVQ